MPSVCIIVVSHDNKEQLRQCLGGLASQTRPADEIIVVDNASRDGSPELVREEFPSSRLMALNSSAGTSAAVNLALDETTADLVGILLVDFVADPDWLASLLAAEDARWDCWASLILDHDGRVHSAGLAMTVVGRAIHIGRGDEPGNYSDQTEVFGGCFPALFVRRQMLIDVLGFDSDFFVEADDVDVAFRGQLRRHSCLFVPEARGSVGPEPARRSSQQVFFEERNSTFVFWQNMPPLRLALYLPERGLYQLSVAVKRFATLRGWSWLRGKTNAARNLGKMLKKRSRVQAGRSAGDREFRAKLTRNWLRGA